MDKMVQGSDVGNTPAKSEARARESTTFPPLGPGYYSTRLNAVVQEAPALSPSLRIGCDPPQGEKKI